MLLSFLPPPEFKECFFFHARKGYISTEADLSIIIRSLNFSVTKDEVSKYFLQAIGEWKDADAGAGGSDGCCLEYELCGSLVCQKIADIVLVTLDVVKQ